MTQDLIDSYQRGGSIYTQIATQFGVAGADTIAAAALSGDETQINAAYSQVKNGSPLDTNTWGIFGSQLVNDPLAAPLSSLNNQLSKAVGNIFKNPFVLLLLFGVLFFSFGGGNLIRAALKK